MQASPLSVDEFASLVAAALQAELDVGSKANRGNHFGGNSRLIMTGHHQGHRKLEELPPPTSTGVHIKRPWLFNWWTRKSKSRTLSNYICNCGPSSFLTREPYAEYRSESELESATNTLSGHTLQPTEAMAFAGDPSPTVLAASMSTVDLGANCLGLVAGGGCGSVCGSISRSHSPGLTVETTKHLKSTGAAGATTPTTPILTFEADTDGEPNRGPYDVNLDANVIDLSSTLRLPRTPSPSSRSPAQRQPISSPPPPPRTPRKSILAKLRTLSSKGSNNSLTSPTSPPTPPIPTLSPSSPNFKNAHIDTNNNTITRASPTGLFSLHLPFPLTPISLSKPASPTQSPSPSPKPPSRPISTLSKRESAPVLSASYANSVGLLATNQGSPVSSDRSAQAVKFSDKRRIQSFYGSIPAPRSPTSKTESSKDDIVAEEKRSTESMLSPAECLECISGTVEKQSKVKEKRMSGVRGLVRRRKDKESIHPFPLQGPPASSELDSVSSNPSKYSCESASRSGHGELITTSAKKSAKGSAGDKAVASPGGTSPVSPVLHPTIQDRSCSGRQEEQLKEDEMFAPFVPLVLQHERLQQKLKKSVPLASFEGAGDVEGVGIKSVAVGPFPPRSSSLSSASVQIRQRTKSAPTAPTSHPLSKSNSKSKERDISDLPIPPVPALPAHIASASATTPTTLRSQPPAESQPQEAKERRPTTAPAGSVPKLVKGSLTGAIPFPVVKEAEEGDKAADATRQRKPSKLFEKMKARKSLPPPLQPSGEEALPLPVANLNLPSEADPMTGSGRGERGSIGLRYTLSMSNHPYANARSPTEGISSPLEADSEQTEKEVKPSWRSSVSLLSSQKATKPTSPQNQVHGLMPTSPTTSNSGSGSEASTKSPITPRSPLFWGVGSSGSAGAGTSGPISIGGVKIRTGMGLGILSSSPQSGEEGSGNEVGKQRSEVETSPCSDEKKNYQMHPYSRPYTHTNVHFSVPAQVEVPTTDNTGDTVSNEQAVSPTSPSSSSTHFVKRRPSKPVIIQNGSGVGAVPTKPPPVGPLPLPPANDKNVESGSETDKQGSKKVTERLSVAVENEVPESPVPSEYIKAFSVPPTPSLDDVEDETSSMSHPYGRHNKTPPSDAHSQSSESYEPDPEYEALLAANTMANVGVLTSMRNIGVGRKLMSACPQPLFEGSSESRRKKAGTDSTRSSLVGTEWTLFLGNDDIPLPSGSKDVFADSRMKSLDGVRARTKSESALNTSVVGDKLPRSIKRARSSTTAGLSPLDSGRSSPPPPVPKLPKRKHVESTEDWTLSLPLLPRGDTEAVNMGSSAIKSRDTRRVPEPLSAAVSTTTLAAFGNSSIVHSWSKRSTLPKPEVVVCVEGVVVEDDDLAAGLDDADDITVAASPVDDTFEIDLDCLGLDDEDESDPESTMEMSGTREIPPDPLLFSVPRVVSKGSGMECATWGAQEIEHGLRKKRRLSDGLGGLMGMTGVSVRLSVNADGESICVIDEQNENAESEEDVSGEPLEEVPMSEAMRENLAKLDALSADLKRFNELLKQGVGPNRIDLKHVKSCGLLPSQAGICQVQVDPSIRIQQSVDGLRNYGPHPISIKPTTGVNVREKVKSWTERSASLASPSNSPIASSSTGNPTCTKIRPPLPFAPSSTPGFAARSHRNIGLGVPSSTQGIGGHRPAIPGRSMSMSMATMTKSPQSSTTASLASTIPVGSGLKVGGNGRVISLSTMPSATPMIPISSVLPGSRVTTLGMEGKEKNLMILGQENEDVSKISKRDSASSVTSTDTFFSFFSSPSPAPSPSPNKSILNRRRASSTSDCSSGSGSSTPTVTVLPSLTIITSSSALLNNSHSPVNEAHTPTSSAMPTPLASSFPVPPPLPASIASLRGDLNSVSKVLAATLRPDHQATSPYKHNVPLFRPPRPVNPDTSRLSSASEVSVQTIMPSAEQRTISTEDDRSFFGAEADTESIYSGSFYSARSSFEA